MNESKQKKKNTGIIAVGNLGTKLISFFLLPLYTAILSTSEYGIVDYVISIATFCTPFVTMLMDEAIFRFLIDCKNESEKKVVISSSLFIVFLGMLSFSIIGIAVMKVIDYDYTYYAVAYILLSSYCGMISALLRGIGRTDLYALFNFLQGVLQVVLNVVFIAIVNMGVDGMLLASVLSFFSVSIIFSVRIKLWEFIKLHCIDRSLVKKMIVYSLPLVPNKISWTIINLSDRIILMNVIGSSATGLYAVSYKFPNLMDTVYGFFYQSWKESSARVLSDENHDNFYNDVYEYLKCFMYSTVLVMSAFMPFVFKFMVSDSYYEAIYYVPILLLATFFSNISGFYGGIFTAYKDTAIMGITTVAAALVNIVVNLTLIFKFGIYAAAISTLVANFVVYLYRKVKVKKYIELYENLKETITSIIATVIIFVLFYRQNVWSIIFSCVIAVLYAFIYNWKLLKYLKKQLKH